MLCLRSGEPAGYVARGIGAARQANQNQLLLICRASNRHHGSLRERSQAAGMVLWASAEGESRLFRARVRRHTSDQRCKLSDREDLRSLTVGAGLEPHQLAQSVSWKLEHCPFD